MADGGIVLLTTGLFQQGEGMLRNQRLPDMAMAAVVD